MIVVPAGSFCMGSPMGESGRDGNEGPVHKVTIKRPFAVGIHEVTFDEWDACVEDGGCGRYNPSAAGWGKGTRPVINVSWNEAKDYVRWLSDRTGEEYRLLTESEWEYAARAGTETPYHFGNTITSRDANYSASGFSRTTPVGTYEPNAFGLHDVHGNVWEWVEDCNHSSYLVNGAAAPADGSAWTENCSTVQKIIRGGSWLNGPQDLRSAKRLRSNQVRLNRIGFRVARTL